MRLKNRIFRKKTVGPPEIYVTWSDPRMTDFENLNKLLNNENMSSGKGLALVKTTLLPGQEGVTVVAFLLTNPSCDVTANIPIEYIVLMKVMREWVIICDVTLSVRTVYSADYPRGKTRPFYYSVLLQHCFSIQSARVISLSGVQLSGFIISPMLKLLY